MGQWFDGLIEQLIEQLMDRLTDQRTNNHTDQRTNRTNGQSLLCRGANETKIWFSVTVNCSL